MNQKSLLLHSERDTNLLQSTGLQKETLPPCGNNEKLPDPVYENTANDSSSSEIQNKQVTLLENWLTTG